MVYIYLNSRLYFLKKKKDDTVEYQKDTHIVSILLLTEGTFRCL